MEILRTFEWFGGFQKFRLLLSSTLCFLVILLELRMIRWPATETRFKLRRDGQR